MQSERQGLVKAGGRAGVRLRIELGRAHVWAEDVQRLGPGSIIPLDCGVQDDVDVYAGGEMIARGAPSSVDGEFSVIVSETFGAGGYAPMRND